MEQQQPSLSREVSDSLHKRQITDYTFAKKLGNGAFGDVYEGFENDTGTKVAIKCVNKDTILRLDKRRHVFREKDILNSMNHPHIIKLLNTC